MTGPVERATHAPLDEIGVEAAHWYLRLRCRLLPADVEKLDRLTAALVAERDAVAVSGVPEGEPTQEAPDENQSGAGGEQP